ncbi:MAG: GxxExxY protein [Verrucomicrobia bacterium]|nr:GxxExxY protein [Verrucomicrobiota bacterium]MCG2678970.1 GxxExxY protein [Kiritimatiellia bacterium]MBU4247626.1 GxxExxY protein [Verrucomicrobiota bacterium]MBU4290807.1 GxxExxY protein [Verrucomicrobiota bacterium]MBU4428353.1 GxxExxY protein [Verrucomicrobiota bacterium]
MMKAGEDKLSYAVIGQAMAVHRELGPGLDEIFYHRLLADKLAAKGIEHQFKPKGQLKHHGIVADEFEGDLIVEGKLVLELKALRGPLAPEHYAQLMCYQKFWAIRTGWLIDFGKESLVRKRVIFDAPDRANNDVLDTLPIVLEACPEKTMLDGCTESIRQIYLEYGLGYRDTTYRGLLSADLRMKGVSFHLNPETDVASGEYTLGHTLLDCMKIGDHGAAIILALHESIRAADRAIMQTYIRLLHVSWGMIVNFGKKQLDVKMTYSTKKE